MRYQVLIKVHSRLKTNHVTPWQSEANMEGHIFLWLKPETQSQTRICTQWTSEERSWEMGVETRDQKDRMEGFIHGPLDKVSSKKRAPLRVLDGPKGLPPYLQRLRRQVLWLHSLKLLQCPDYSEWRHHLREINISWTAKGLWTGSNQLAITWS